MKLEIFFFNYNKIIYGKVIGIVLLKKIKYLYGIYFHISDVILFLLKHNRNQNKGNDANVIFTIKTQAIDRPAMELTFLRLINWFFPPGRA